MDRSDWLGKQVIYIDLSPCLSSALNKQNGVIVAINKECNRALVYFFNYPFIHWIDKENMETHPHIEFPINNGHCNWVNINNLFLADETNRVFKYNIGDKVKCGSVNGIVVGYNLDVFGEDTKIYLVCLENGGIHSGNGWNMIADLQAEYEGKCSWFGEKELCIDGNVNNANLASDFDLDTKVQKFHIGDAVWVVNSNDPTYHKKGIIFAYDYNDPDADISTYKVYFEDEDPRLHDCNTEIKILDNHCWYHIGEDLEPYAEQDETMSKNDKIIFDDENLIPVRIKPDDQLPYDDTADGIGFTPGKLYYWDVRENFLVDDYGEKRPWGNFNYSQKESLKFLMLYFDIVQPDGDE